ncbi:hypothetical protein [Crenalkalicoccus roseus]|uniref:hypothetical protein n=1 Tax=Crenalkalicoccus roseus TaxID=1485588 RepID=UPI001080D1D5|nr:hypothetical protein [Crenalkalicoccus roseus]
MFRAICLCLGLFASYSALMAQERCLRRGTLSRLLPLVLLLFAAAILAHALLGAGWVNRRISAFLIDVPLDAALIGALIGYLLADQQRGAERAAQAGAPAARGKDRDAPPPRTTAELLRAAKEGAGGLALAVLVVAGLFPVTEWRPFLARVTGFSMPAGIGVTLGSAAGDRTAEAIRQATTFADPTGKLTADRNGFVPHRLHRMRSLTHPPPPESGPETLLTTHFAAEPTSPSAGVQQARTGAPQAKARVHQVERDRATIIHLLLAQTIQELGQPAGRAAPGARVVPSAMAAEQVAGTVRGQAARLAPLGGAQEGMLASMAPAIACLNAFVANTGERALLEYRSTKAVEYLTRLAKYWSRLEHQVMLDRLRGHPGAEAARRALRQPSGVVVPAAGGAGDRHDMAEVLRYLVRELFRAHNEVVRWARGFQHPWLLGQWQDREDTRCQPLGEAEVERLARFVVEEFASEASLGTTGFSPYLSLLAAMALASLGDHEASFRLLAEWLDDLARLVEALDRPPEPERPSPQTLVAQAAAQGGPVADAPDREALRAAWLWHQLYVYQEILYIQESSEGTAAAVPVTESGLRGLILRFHQVLGAAGQRASLPEWTSGPERACDLPANRWRQAMVSSYAGWLQAHLNMRHRRYVRPEDATAEDQEQALLLIGLDMACFTNILRDPREREKERALYAVTAATILMNRLAGGRVSSWDRQALTATTERALEAAIHTLREGPRGNGASSAQASLLGQAEHPLQAVARGMMARLEKERDAR